MSDLEDANPYDDSGLREAYRQGWKARVKGKPRPMDLIIQAKEKRQAWPKGCGDHDAQDARD